MLIEKIYLFNGLIKIKSYVKSEETVFHIVFVYDIIDTLFLFNA